MDGLLAYLNETGENPALYEYAGSLHEHSRDSQSDLIASSMSIEDKDLIA
jgi:hypothetical protein